MARPRSSKVNPLALQLEVQSIKREIAGLESASPLTAWGDIAGTLADQTDLQAALDAKADSSHTHAIYEPLSIKAVKTADTTRTGTATRTDDPDLFIALEASSRYFIKFFLRTAAGTNCDFTFNLAGPSGATIEHTSLASVNGNPTTGTSAVNIASSGAAAIRHGWFRGYVQTDTTPGNLTIQWAQQVSNGENAILKEGSWIIATKL